MEVVEAARGRRGGGEPSAARKKHSHHLGLAGRVVACCTRERTRALRDPGGSMWARCSRAHVRLAPGVRTMEDPTERRTGGLRLASPLTSPRCLVLHSIE